MSASDDEFDAAQRREMAAARRHEGYFVLLRCVYDRLTDHTAPKPRHDALLSSDGTFLYVYGGDNVCSRYIWRYNLLTGAWKILNPAGTNRQLTEITNITGAYGARMNAAQPFAFLDIDYWERDRESGIVFCVTRQLQPAGEDFRRESTEIRISEYAYDLNLDQYTFIVCYDEEGRRFLLRDKHEHVILALCFEGNAWKLAEKSALWRSINPSWPDTVRQFIREAGDGAQSHYYGGRVFTFRQSAPFGFGEVLAYDLESRTYSIETLSADPHYGIPSMRKTKFANAKNLVFLVGGAFYPHVLRDVWRLDLETKEWRKLGRIPEKVMRHSTMVVDEFIYVFGGIIQHSPKPSNPDEIDAEVRRESAMSAADVDASNFGRRYRDTGDFYGDNFASCAPSNQIFRFRIGVSPLRRICMEAAINSRAPQHLKRDENAAELRLDISARDFVKFFH